jgi:hypothetical protein
MRDHVAAQYLLNLEAMPAAANRSFDARLQGLAVLLSQLGLVVGTPFSRSGEDHC